MIVFCYILVLIFLWLLVYLQFCYLKASQLTIVNILQFALGGIYSAWIVNLEDSTGTISK